MPFPIVAAIGAAGSLIGNAINAGSQANMNKKTRRYNKEMYARQRADSLSDWAMQNQYNSPREQMARYRDAGLNENLIYGQTNEANPVRSTSADSWNPRAPQVDLTEVGSSLGSIYDIRIKEAQADNLTTQNQVLLVEALLKKAQVDSTLTNTERAKLELDIASTLKQNTIETAGANLGRIRAETQMTLNEDERKAAMNSADLKIAAEKILTMRLDRAKTSQEIENLKAALKNLDADKTLKDLDIEMKRTGIQPHDALWQRALMRVINSVSGNPNKETVDFLKKKFNLK